MIASEFYIKNIILQDIFNKFRNVPVLESIKLRVYLSDVMETDDTSILDCFCLLSFIARNKPFCTKLKRRIDKRHFAISFEYFVEIRGEVMYDFLYYFMMCRLNYIAATRNDVSKEILFMLRNYLFIVEDVNFWLNLPEEFKGFRWPINVELCFNSICDDDKAIILYFLNALKFPTFDKRAFFRSKEEILSEKKNAQLLGKNIIEK